LLTKLTGNRNKNDIHHSKALDTEFSIIIYIRGFYKRPCNK